MKVRVGYTPKPKESLYRAVCACRPYHRRTAEQCFFVRQWTGGARPPVAWHFAGSLWRFAPAWNGTRSDFALALASERSGCKCSPRQGGGAVSRAFFCAVSVDFGDPQNVRSPRGRFGNQPFRRFSGAVSHRRRTLRPPPRGAGKRSCAKEALWAICLLMLPCNLR